MALFEPTINIVGLVTLCCALVSLFVAILLIIFNVIAPNGNQKMREISKAIQQGALAFIVVEYFTLFIFVVVMVIVLSTVVNWQTGLCYLVGSVIAATSGAIGMMISTISNVKTTAAAQKSMYNALRVAFNSGSVMGLSVVGSGLLGISVLYLIFREDAFNNKGVIAGFGMGATTVSFFSRVGGGIFTKAADVGADLVGKVETGIPEDDPRNPATIADNVGDNVGDIAGMGSDLNGSFNGSIIASALLGYTTFGTRGVAFPLWICSAGVFSAMIGMFFVRCRRNSGQTGVLIALRTGLVITNIVQVGFMAGITAILEMPWMLFGNILIGLVTGFVIALNSEFFTSPKYRPTQSIASSAQTGAASVIIQGLSISMISIVFPSLIIAFALLACMMMSGVYGAALASTGLLSSLAFTLAIDAYGPVADNAGGIAEMAGLDPKVRERTDILDAIGNTTAAVGKGSAIAAAVLTGFSLLNVFKQFVGLGTFDIISDPFAIAGIICGSTLPFFFSSLTMGAVAQGASVVVYEVRRQFKEIPGIMDFSAKPNYFRCVVLITAQSIHSMIIPGLLTIGLPMTVGIAFPPQFLASFLLGNMVTGFLLAAMKAAAGGAWDNAKKYIETGKFGGKKSEAHKAAVVGDTVGDPFKDTSGPAINILIKLSNYASVVLAPVYVQRINFWWVAIILFVFLFVLSFIIWGLSIQNIERMYNYLRGNSSKNKQKQDNKQTEVELKTVNENTKNETEQKPEQAKEEPKQSSDTTNEISTV